MPIDSFAVLGAVRRLIANDAHAMTFQTLSQYRTALINAIDASVSEEQRRALLAGELDWSKVTVDAPDLPGWKPSTLPLSDDQLRKAMTNATVARAYAVGADPKTAAHPASLLWCREFARAVLNAAGVIDPYTSP